jgi:polysaccharide chain length determinant protein (PEP-CTERM system associated)
VLPNKKYTPEEVARILARRAWIVVLSLGICAGAAVGVSKSLPNKFRSETLIMLMPQRIPDAYVKAQVTAKIEDRLNSLEDQILSRSRLERIILDLNLYDNLRRTLPMEDVVQRMRDDIEVKVEGKESFRISYVSREARTAQKATERLASLFIEENMRDRENMAEDTNQFLNSQLEDAKRRLVEHEKKLEEYRSRFGGELPTQVSINLQAIQNAQVQLQGLADASDRARERRLLIERQLADLQSDVAPVVAAPVGSDPVPGETTTQQLQAARSRLEGMLLRMKPEHPDIRAMRRTISELEARLEAQQKERPATGQTEPIKELPAVERVRQQRMKDLKLQLEDIDRQLAEKQEQDRRLRVAVAEYQAKLDAVPKRESDLVELTRDYTTLQASYQSLLVKREEAKLAANLERRNIGEQFKVLDPARAPERPFSPNRIAIDAGGAVGGLAIGLLLIGLLEYRDSSFTCEDDVVRVLNVRVLALVPLIVSEAEQRTRKRKITFFGMAVVVLAASGAALAFWRLRL